ncbi:MAG: hypothetical protein HYR63_25695 [Proteobacteria bacterium]|nr:hypothetical protein [Pseudomonadota bacterium]MBI3497326.1 hypothetical protein [Pseudomonadota bacterium]
MTSDRSRPTPSGPDPLARVLAAWRLAPADPGLGERILARVMDWPQVDADPSSRRLLPRWSFGWLVPRIVSLAAGIAIGIVVGLSEPMADEVASGLYSSLFDQSSQTLLAFDATDGLTP